ncbi:hypothetical protein FRACYDRAFT_240778 [Fragilariopsis cylindrus CCMP1102]|uniref:Uncharacterized protein n=1 Tax=Fragilariopsis cylindrus CCMP1102 TaxID=635003 RepID=A0A1E7F8B1_9STRA|nr:hypothetical protein FRACYDRAFT_240778 [Fragilariopsis cylindrus CCMP1102]|eukprot:OEU14245.1 hypothetical protein FRACYDRAFT_240778 [Fragilariopsis cylindrus CCMP1102]
MDDPNVENEDDGEQQEAQAEEQEQLDAAAAVAAETKQRHLKISSILERKEKFTYRNRNKINVLIKEFLEKLGDDIHDMFFDTTYDADTDTYHGLESDCDTEEEVETAIRFFPEVLSRRKAVYEGHLHYPIQALALAHDVHNQDFCISFIPIVARLAIEFDLFEEDERGGLLCLDSDGDNVLHLLMDTDDHQEQHEAVDDKYLQALIKLRQLDLLKKEDIQSYDLLHCLCIGGTFPENRYKMLVEWDPNALTQTDRFGRVPLNCSMVGGFNAPTIQGFQSVFEYGIRYFPKKKGISLLFHKPNSLLTPFQYACKKYGGEKVKKIIKDTLARYSRSTPINSADAVLSAAIDESVHLDVIRVRVESDSNTAPTTTTTSSKRRDETFLDIYSFRVGSTIYSPALQIHPAIASNNPSSMVEI